MIAVVWYVVNGAAVRGHRTRVRACSVDKHIGQNYNGRNSQYVKGGA